MFSQDQVVYTILSANQPDIDRVFYMDPLTGIFYLRKSLEGTLITFYNVSLSASFLRAAIQYALGVI